MAIKQFYSKEEWLTALEARDLEYSGFGFIGSASAHNIEGKVVGEWIEAADTCDGRASGWLTEEV